METITSIIVGLIAVGALWLSKWGLGKLHISIDNQILALSVVKKAIDGAELYAQAKLQSAGEKIPSESKLKLACQYIDGAVQNHPEIKDYLIKQKEALIEKVLKSNLVDEKTQA